MIARTLAIASCTTRDGLNGPARPAWADERAGYVERVELARLRQTLLVVARDVEPRRLATRVVADEHAVVVPVEVNVLWEASGRAAGRERPKDGRDSACHQ